MRHKITEKMPPHLITLQETAKRLGVSYGMVHRWAVLNLIPNEVFYSAGISKYRGINPNDLPHWKQGQFWQIQKMQLQTEDKELRRRGRELSSLYIREAARAKELTRFVS